MGKVITITSEDDLKQALDELKRLECDENITFTLKKLAPDYKITLDWFDKYDHRHSLPDPYNTAEDQTEDLYESSSDIEPHPGDVRLFGADTRPLYGILLSQENDMWTVLPLSYITEACNSMEYSLWGGPFKGALQVWNIRHVPAERIKITTPAATIGGKESVAAINADVKRVLAGVPRYEGDVRGADKLRKEDEDVARARAAYLASEKALWDAALA